MKENAQRYLEELISRYPVLEVCVKDIYAAAELLINCYRNNGKVLVCGNGGSAADSLHMVGELMKGFVLPRKLDNDIQEKLRLNYPEMAEYYIENLQASLPAISLINEVGLTTAYANDKAPDLAFAQQVLGYGKCGDVLFAVSTSGNSKNIIYAAEVAKVCGIKVIGLSGESGGKMNTLCDICIKAPSSVTFKIQEYHLPIYHALCLCLEEEFFGKH